MRGYGTGADYEGDTLDYGLLRELVAPAPDGSGLPVERLDDVTLRCYYIVLDGFSSAKLSEMIVDTMDEVWPEIQRGHQLSEDWANIPTFFGCVNSYLRRREGAAGF